MSYYGAAPILFESVSQVTLTPSVDLGTRRHEAGKEYLYCYNNTGSAVTQGALMVASALSGYSLTRSSTAAADLPLVGVENTSLAAAEYFWGLVRGPMSVMSVAMTAGALITIGADGVVQTALVGSFPTGPVIGKALTTSTANAQPSCLLRLFG